MPSDSPFAGTPDLVALGRALRTIRERRDLPQEAVGYDAGLGKGYVHALETGRLNPTFVVLLAVTRTLGATMPEVVAVWQRHIDELDPHADDVPRCPTADALAYMERVRARIAGQRAAKARRAAGRMRPWT